MQRTIQGILDIPLSQEQKEAVILSAKCVYSVIYGSAGTGKTTVMKKIGMTRKKVLFLAPTATAAFNIRQRTGFKAYTIHIILASEGLLRQFQGYEVVVDEASMMSIELLAKLLIHLHPVKVSLVGDHRQLDCIDGFSALTTFLKIDQVPKKRLLRNFRTRAGTYLELVVEALAITGKEPVHPPSDDSYRVQTFNSEEAAINYVVENFDINTKIVAHQRRDIETFNKRTANKEREGEETVVCRKNLYAFGKKAASGEPLVCNGMMGIKTSTQIKYSNGYVDRIRRVVRADGREKWVFKTIFEPARAITVHSSQGQEFEKGIVYISADDSYLSLSLIFTAISRFKEKVLIVGDERAITKLLNRDKAFLTPEQVDEAFGNKFDEHFVETFQEGWRRQLPETGSFIQ